VRNRKIWWIVAAAVVVLSIVGVVVARGRSQKPMAVQTARADLQKIVQKVSATGKIQPRTKVDISADVSGKIERLAVTEGQWVEKGAFLIGLARDRYLAAVESAVANVSAAEANAALVQENLKRTSNEFERSKQLLAGGNESKSAFEAKQAEHLVEVARLKAAQDQVAQARAALRQSRDDLAKTTIYAPMAGTISALNKEQGEIALGSQFQKDVILVIGDLTQMEAQVNVDENDIGSIAIGQAAEIEVDALPDRVLSGVVSEISNSANTSGQGSTDQKTEFAIKVSITHPPKELRPGMTASAEIITKTEERALSIPIQSVAVRTVDQLAMKGEKREDAEKRYRADKDGFAEIVFCVEAGKAVARQVKTGIQSETRIQVLEGLKAGDEVVTGSYRAISKDLVNGATITISKEPVKEPGGERAAGAG
jgi:HlyD family secretion protein